MLGKLSTDVAPAKQIPSVLAWHPVLARRHSAAQKQSGTISLGSTERGIASTKAVDKL